MNKFSKPLQLHNQSSLKFLTLDSKLIPKMIVWLYIFIKLAYQLVNFINIYFPNLLLNHFIVIFGNNDNHFWLHKFYFF